MEKQKICKICSKRFANGKAMGGHMRSHLVKLPIPAPKQHGKPVTGELTQPSPSSSSSLNFPSGETTMQCYRSLNGELYHAGDSDRESENESRPRNPTRRRSKRPCKIISPLSEPTLEPEPASSISDTFSEVDVAMCLLKLSRDTWPKGKEIVRLEDDESVDEEQEDEDNYSLATIRRRTRQQVRFKCGTCKKVFPSYQALGGHRASHKKTRNHFHGEHVEERKVGGTGPNRNIVVDRRVFECEYCCRVFESGQALGGHKKVHFSNASDARTSARVGDNLIDLNLPAPEVEDEASQAAFSTVSNAE